MELSDSTRESIRLEEVYREEVRRALVDKGSANRRNRVVSFFNTNLGLWLLSAIFISGLGTAYRYYEARHEEQQLRLSKQLDDERARAVVAERIDREISYRLSQTLLRLGSIDGGWHYAQKFPDVLKLVRKPFQPLEMCGQAIRDLLNKPRPPNETDETLPVYATDRQPLSDRVLRRGFLSLYPEYDSYDMLTLMAELEANVTPRERDQLDKARFQLIHDPIPYFAPKYQSPGLLFASHLLECCVLPRWKKPSFELTTCTSGDPFCKNLSPASPHPRSAP